MHEIRMAHPAKNALGSDLLGWLHAALDDADGRPILLTGTDDAFCAGLDLREVAALQGEAMIGFLRSMDDLAARLYDYPAPVVGALNGHAIAGGCVLAQCCDHRVVTSNPRTRIGLNEVALGVCFPPRILGLLRNRLGAREASTALLGAALDSPAKARELGLVDELADDPLAVARARLAQLAAHPREAYARTKAELRRGATDVSPEDERRFVEEELPIWTSDEVRERVLAVLG